MFSRRLLISGLFIQVPFVSSVVGMLCDNDLFSILDMYPGDMLSMCDISPPAKSMDLLFCGNFVSSSM